MDATIRSLHRRPREAGQALVVMVGVMLLSIALLALIVDGGNVMTQQRATQTGSDSTAEAGAIVLATRLANSATPAGGWDASVAAKVAQSAASNKIAVQAAYYTDICGIPLKSDGTAALNLDGTENLAAAMQVGSGGLPGGSATTPDCPSLSVGPVSGVMVLGTKDVTAFVAGAIGIKTFKVTTRATAVSGYLQGVCAASQGSSCAVLPVTIPVNTVTCNGSNDVIPGSSAWPWNTVLTVPLCKSNPGNVGWLDWTPTGGGTSELEQSILHPNNPPINLPSWQYVTSTGNVNSKMIEDAIRTYDGTVVLIPQFDTTCRTKNSDPDPNNSQPAVVTPPDYGCPNPAGGGNGQNLWYHMPSFAYFELCDPASAGCGGRYGAYINGNNKAECDTGNGATSCLVGKFVDILATGTVGQGSGSGTGSKTLGVQLIK
jgi:hypothetical protein